MSGIITRREMTTLLLTDLGVMSGGPRMLLARGAPLASWASDEALVEFLNRSLGDADFGAIATEWRRLHPGESARDTLVTRLLANRSPREPIDALVARKVAAEHSGEKAVWLDGWFLAPTEARLVALVELVRAGG